jgi:hypothetical protein
MLGGVRIMVTRKGGFAGVPASGTRDDADLTDDQRQAIAELLKTPPQVGASAGADRFQYDLTIHDDHDATHQLSVPEESMPAALAAIPQIAL